VSKPERLNLAIGKHCFVHCEGCYTFFGESQPDLDALLKTVARFVELGIDKVTISGGDPLTVVGITDFLVDIRGQGIKLIKLDTVGSNLVRLEAAPSGDGYSEPTPRLRILVETVDYLGIPLDGWSNEIVQLFRVGRKRIYEETCQLLSDIDRLNRTPNVVINTVLFQGNHHGLSLMLQEIARHRCVCHWNIFQYMPTDQVMAEVNDRYYIGGDAYDRACESLVPLLETTEWAGERPEVEFRSVRSRLGEYLLVNSDGHAWLPDVNGSTIYLGEVYGHETEVLQKWAEQAGHIQALKRGHDLS